MSLTVLRLVPGLQPEVLTIEPTLENLRRLVNSAAIEVAEISDSYIAIVGTGYLDNPETEMQTIFGNFFPGPTLVVGQRHEGGDFLKSLTSAQVEDIIAHYE